jgi:hypothetical protein
MTRTQADDTVSFLEWHRPAIDPGDYTIQVTQEVSAAAIPKDTFPSPSMTFSIRGERFALPPGEVHSVFPPDASMGDHANVLPHVVLSRSTLPWERHADQDDEATPWLALLVFHDGDEGLGQPKTMSLGEAMKDSPKFHYHANQLERGQTQGDQVAVIDVKKELLDKVIPNKAELCLLAHARGRGETELAVIIANRLPKPNGFSTAYLVSLEGHYKGDDFEFKDAPKDEFIRLISLTSFRFGCFEPKQSFTELLRALDGGKSVSNNQSSSTLRLPDLPAAPIPAREQLALGSVPMRHSLRQGETTVSWFHGPLAPAAPAKNLEAAAPTTVRVADEMLRYSPTTGMFDVSYASAWEIGRLLALQDKKFSVELQHWKQEHAKLRPHGLADSKSAHPLANPNAPPSLLPPPEQIRVWLAGLSLLEGVPFSYLGPDERMLPPESIRIFWLDSLWIECLLDGACSIGRHTDADVKRDTEHKTKGHLTNPHPVVTGVILRSAVVSGWPGLQVDGYNELDSKKPPVKPLRTERLSPNVLACFFDREIKEVRIHQKVEALHFGFDKESNGLVKKLRNNDGTDSEHKKVELEGVDALKNAWKDAGKRILHIDNLAGEIKHKTDMKKNITSAEFALQMIEKVEGVTFSITPPA